jgi:hypothetical protein
MKGTPTANKQYTNAEMVSIPTNQFNIYATNPTDSIAELSFFKYLLAISRIKKPITYGTNKNQPKDMKEEA